MLTTSVEARADNIVMRLVGVLDARTYAQVRDEVLKAAVDAPAAVIIDIDGLEVRSDRGWSVFTSARWHVQQWPDVVIALACRDPLVRQRLTDLSVTPYVPVYASVAAATAAIGEGSCRYLHRAREEFGPHSFSVRATQIFVRGHLMAWSMLDKIPVTSTVATVFAENALSYTSHGFDVRLEATGADVLVAVSDTSTTPAIQRERPPDTRPTGLDIVAALCRRWGSTPRPGGKTVWAHIGPDDTLAGLGRLLQ
jgi:anti-anti-sigma regulatory factor